MRTHRELRSFIVTRAQFAYLAIAHGAQRLLALDGGLGLLHVGADLEQARAQLETEGLLVEGEVTDPLKEMFEVAREPVRSIVLHISPSGRQRWSAYLAFFPGGEDAVLFGPATTGLDFAFVVERLTLDQALDFVIAVTGLTGAAEAADEPFQGAWTISIQRYADALRCVDSGDSSGATDVFSSAGWPRPVAESLTDLLSRKRSAVEFHHVLRLRPTELVIDEASWLAGENGEAWRFEVADEARLIFAPSSRSSFVRELTQAMTGERA